jgi:hypothetical protein
MKVGKRKKSEEILALAPIEASLALNRAQLIMLGFTPHSIGEQRQFHPPFPRRPDCWSDAKSLAHTRSHCKSWPEFMVLTQYI